MTTILTKKSDTPGAVPATANLTNAAGGAELAVNTADKRLFSINSSSSVIEIGTNPSSLTVAGEGSITVFRSESATITNLTATSATIDNFTFTSATVTRLAATSAVITDLSATVGRIESGTITQLVSTSASISNLSSASASITTLTGVSANITTLTGTTFGTTGTTQLRGASGAITTLTGTTLGYTSGSITNLAVTSLTVSSLSLSNATFTSATITTLKSTSATVDNLASTSANITTLTGTTFGTTATTQLRGASAQITTLTGTSANITTVTGTTAGFSSGNITQFGATSATIGTLTGTSANVTTLSGTTLTYGSGSITNLAVTSLTVSSLSLANATFTSATITTLTGTSANITTVTGTTAGFGSANITQLGSTSATIGTLTGTSANITTLTGTTFGTTATTQLRGASAQITTLTATSSNITTLTGTTATFTSATVTNLNLTSLTLGNLSVTSANITTLTSASGTITNLLATTANISGAAVISVNSSSNALRITQVGAGNALLVEDSANPDATPFVIDASGRVVVGYTISQTLVNTPPLQVAGTGGAGTQVAIINNTNNLVSPARIQTYKSQSGNTGTFGIVSNNSDLGAVDFYGDDGVGWIPAAQILAEVDGTPGTNDMPGRLVFSTTADGAASPTERLRIDSAGNVGVGITPSAGRTFTVGKNLTGAVSSYGIFSSTTVQPDVTSNAFLNATNCATASNGGTPYTISNIIHNNASQGTFNADSTVTNQIGFFATSSLIGATNNYGFYSNIASGTNRWNFYAAGTADNFFGGPTTISVNSSSNALRITQVGAGNALVVEDSANPDSTPVVIDSGGNLIQGNTAVVAGVVTGSLQTQGTGANGSSHNLQAYSASTGGTLEFDRSRGALGAQSVVSSGDRLGRIFFCGSDGAAFIRGAEIYADVDGTPGTNDMPGRLVFGTTADGASSPTERMRIDNAGIVYINTTTNTNSSQLVVSGTISEAVAGTQYLVASQYDIGTDPNEIPLNQYLGALAYVDSEWVAPQVGSGITGGTGTICKTSFAVEGGVKKMQVLIDLTGLNSGGTAGDIIGVNGTANPCYIAQIPSTFTILGGRMTCLETPAGGDTDIDLYSATEGTGVEDQAITALTETQIINAGTQSAGTVTYFAADPAANTYFYLVGQSTSNATYTAGRFLIEVFGA